MAERLTDQQIADRIANRYFREREVKATKAQDAIAVLIEEGWIWDGDQWQRPEPLGDEWSMERILLLALGAIGMMQPCAAPDCQAEQAEYKDAAERKIRAALERLRAAPPEPRSLL